MTSRERSELRGRLDDAGVAVSGIASYVRVAFDADDEMVIGALSHAMSLATDLGAPMVRVFPGASTAPAANDRVPALIEPTELVDEGAARQLNAVAGIADELGVYPVLEMHDSHPRGADIRRILQQVTGPVGAIWDLMHPWRIGEPVERTWEILSPWLENNRGGMQVKDANLPEDATPLAIGDGTVPTAQFGSRLRSVAFEGTVCLEWERTWHPRATQLDEALISTRAWYDRYFPAGSES